jgi:hypothetical protein
LSQMKHFKKKKKQDLFKRQKQDLFPNTNQDFYRRKV